MSSFEEMNKVLSEQKDFFIKNSGSGVGPYPPIIYLKSERFFELFIAFDKPFIF